MTLVRSFEDFAPPPRFDSLPFTEVVIEESALSDSGFTTIDTIALSPVDADPSSPQLRNFTTDQATLDPAWYRLTWKDAAHSTFVADAIYFPTTDAAYATSEDVTARLGRDLTDAEAASVDFLLEAAGGLIREALLKPEDWEPDPVPSVFRFLSVEVACRIFANPESAGLILERLGAHEHRLDFRGVDGSGGLFLSPAEIRRLRMAVYGRTTESVRVGSIFREVGDT